MARLPEPRDPNAPKVWNCLRWIHGPGKPAFDVATLGPKRIVWHMIADLRPGDYMIVGQDPLDAQTFRVIRSQPNTGQYGFGEVGYLASLERVPAPVTVGGKTYG